MDSTKENITEVNISGAANTAQQFLNAGLVDELHVDVMPVLQGHGASSWQNTSPVSYHKAMNYTVLNRNELPHDGNTYEFEGTHYQDTEVSFIWVDMPPGGTIGLHRHPYEEIFIIQEGVATFTLGANTLEAHAGQIIIVPANVAHRFMNLSDKQLKQIDIHVHKQFVTEWL